MEKLDGMATGSIFSRLQPSTVAALASVSRSLRASVDDDIFWRDSCSRDFDLSSPLGPDGERCLSFKIAYGKWRDSFSKYPWTLVTRAKRCWDGVKNWLADNFVETLETLHKGASEEEIEHAEKKLEIKLPLPTRLLYRLVNGQDTFDPDRLEDERFSMLGVIGGYCIFDHLVNVHVFPLSMVVAETREYRSRQTCSSGSKRIVIAASQMDEKWFLLDCADGRLLVQSVKGDTIPCVPRGSISLSGDGPVQDGMLLWLEEHLRRLRAGEIQVRAFSVVKMICSFPEARPSCAIAEANGVTVRASVIFVPELSKLSGKKHYCFALSKHLSFSSEGCVLDGIRHGSCRLSSRGWILYSGADVIYDVREDVEIDEILPLPDEGELVFANCVSLPDASGSLWISLRFVLGWVANPDGRQFEIQTRVPLFIPGYIF